MDAIKIPEILLPRNADMSKWAVNACDQYTSDSGYWQDVERITAGEVSAYNLIFPEIYLKDEPERRIARINETMRRYLSGGIFKKIDKGFILVERTTVSGTRTGVVLAIDLEQYSFKEEDKALIRSTEATIAERIPPRVQIRQNAPLELPHIMLLYNDKENRVLNSVKRGKVLYDFGLMKNGGHVKGTYIENAQELISEFYGLCQDSGLLFAVGDGNHSLATAKTCWDNLKNTLTETERKTHPARFALAEAVNIYDPALKFEPIHRFVKTDKEDLFLSGLATAGGGQAYIVSKGKKQKIPFNQSVPVGIKELDGYISEFLNKFGGEVDYIHGGQDLINLTKFGGVGILLPAIKKDDFFRNILTDGNMPRKTFSMGEGFEKRYYIEAKTII